MLKSLKCYRRRYMTKELLEGIRDKASNTAETLLKEGYSDSYISQVTGLELDEINKLKFKL
jgi:uncharacterized protein YdaT